MITLKTTAAMVWLLLGALIIIGPFIAFHIIIKNTKALAYEFNRK
jgi:hypothetical protein